MQLIKHVLKADIAKIASDKLLILCSREDMLTASKSKIWFKKYRSGLN